MASKIYAYPYHLCAPMKFVSDRYQRARLKFAVLVFALLCYISHAYSQDIVFDRGDTLRGALSLVRTCYDVHHYDLWLRIDTSYQSIKGKNIISFSATTDFQDMQVDLFKNMVVATITFENQPVQFKREFNSMLLHLPRVLSKGEHATLEIEYFGKPRVAKNPPWDGGFIWTTSENNQPWIAVSCQGIGASLWWPCKDHLSDEPDSMDIHCQVPPGLVCVSNGQDRGITFDKEGIKTFNWHVSYPINNYNVSINIGDYVHMHDVYEDETGDTLSLDYYVIRGNEKKATEHFKQVKPMLACYEKFLGKYPFPDDGYALVQTPYLGMEHQGAIAYGNKFRTGYLGSDRSGQQLKFDYIIIHETGHEWWGNSVTAGDIADMWIHESFCTYSEAIYVECMHGYDTAMTYVNALKKTVLNNTSIMGIYGVNHEGHYDMYVKGMLFLNTLRHVVNNDELWWHTIKTLSDSTFKHSVTDYNEIVSFFEEKTNLQLAPLFEQYVKHAELPVLEYSSKKAKNGTTLRMRWTSNVENFAMPINLILDGTSVQVNVNSKWSRVTLPSSYKFDQLTSYYTLKKVKTQRRMTNG
jgi:aminopeptidase N